MRRRQRGFGAIAAIVVLVICALLSAAVVTLSTTQHRSSALDIQSAAAWQAARAGNEWGLYQALRNGNCAATGTTLDLGTGFFVTVSCASWSYNEGESAPGTANAAVVYQITAVACPVNGCPASAATAATPGYVERRRVVLATN